MFDANCRAEVKNGCISIVVGEKYVAVGKLRAIVVDDEPTYRGLMRRTVEKYGYEVHESGTVDAARVAMELCSFDLGLFDNIYGAPEREVCERGSAFLVRTAAIMPVEMKKVLVTGYATGFIEGEHALATAGVAVVPKMPGHAAQIEQIAKDVRDDKVQRSTTQAQVTMQQLADAVDERTGMTAISLGGDLVVRALVVVREYFERMSEPTVKQFSFFGKDYSPRDVVQELNTGSELGKKIVAMHLDDLLE